jgi:hypothetical protein
MDTLSSIICHDKVRIIYLGRYKSFLGLLNLLLVSNLKMFSYNFIRLLFIAQQYCAPLAEVFVRGLRRSG